MPVSISSIRAYDKDKEVTLNLSTLIIYFTGTGNSLMVAKAIAVELEDAEVVPISRLRIDTAYDRLGLVFPVYWGGLPLLVQGVLPALKNFQETYIFAIATHAGGPGQTLSQLRAELQQVGSDLSAGFFLKMPSNYIISYSAPSEQSIERDLTNAERVISNIIAIIRGKITHRPAEDFHPFFGTSSSYNQFIAGVNKSDEKFWIDENCTECGICERVCPVQNITLDNGQPQWLHKCEQCLACINWCPEEAIQFGTGTSSRGRYTNPQVSPEDMEQH